MSDGRGVNVTSSPTAAGSASSSEGRRAVATSFPPQRPDLRPGPSFEWAGRTWQCRPTMPAWIDEASARAVAKKRRRARQRLTRDLYEATLKAVVVEFPALSEAWKSASPAAHAVLADQVPLLVNWYEEHGAIVDEPKAG